MAATQDISKQSKQYERTENCDSSRMRQAVKACAGLGWGHLDDQFAILEGGLRPRIGIEDNTAASRQWGVPWGAAFTHAGSETR